MTEQTKIAGKGWVFHFNDSTGLGELHVNGQHIPLAEGATKEFMDAPEDQRPAIAVRHLQVRDAVLAAKRGKK